MELLEEKGKQNMELYSSGDDTHQRNNCTHNYVIPGVISTVMTELIGSGDQLVWSIRKGILKEVVFYGVGQLLLNCFLA